jgi:hypothetical protein
VPRWRFPYHLDGMPSLDMRVQIQDNPHLDLSGIVDSGASSTVLATGDAEKLGLRLTDLCTAGSIIVADENKIRCWTAAVPIRAHVLRPSTSGEDLLPWDRYSR